ncbi:IucA/IucC family protein [Methylopila henanensis]|uniref:IucA/IucC family protein n=1 Tax=Methylopila henanensis TaxID=873516 RepID=A0ABW4K2D3_9HYPH
MPSRCDAPEDAEARVVRQLAAALIYEELVEAVPMQVEGAAGFVWTLNGLRWRAQGATGPFGRPRLRPGSVEVRSRAGVWAAARLDAFASALPGDAGELGRELARTVALCRWNAAHVHRGDRRDLAFSELDAALDEGHPYHPSFKARTGFSDDDHRRFGPEAGATFQLHWLAVSPERIDAALPADEATFLAREFGPETFAELDRRRTGADADGFGLCPIHPWQWAALKDGALAPRLADGSIRALGPAGPRYRATQSVRTLANVDDPARANVKLAMNMGNTSALRTIEPHSVTVAPALSDWLTGIVAGDPGLSGRLAIQREYAGIVVDRDGPLGGQIAALWRESVPGLLEPGEEAVPFNALMATERDGAPFIDRWLRRHGASAWVDRLIEVAALPVWRMLAAHGVATEAHGQNMVLVHRGGWPERVILRDFHDSVEVTPDFLAAPDAFPDFGAIDPVYRDAAPDAYFVMSSVEELRALVMDALFVFNLTEVSDLLARRYGFPEAEFWRRVERALYTHAAAHGLGARQARLGFTAPEIAVERLLARKLDPGSARSRAVPNIFAPSGARAREAS